MGIVFQANSVLNKQQAQWERSVSFREHKGTAHLLFWKLSYIDQQILKP